MTREETILAYAVVDAIREIMGKSPLQSSRVDEDSDETVADYLESEKE